MVADLREWERWSPWEALDPHVRREYSGPESGEGAYCAWRGNRRVGEGNMMVASATPETVTLRIVSIRPWKANMPSTFQFQATETGTGTRVIWTLYGEHRGLGGLLARLRGTEKNVGKDFDRGLARLKDAAERAAAEEAAADSDTERTSEGAAKVSGENPWPP